MPLSASSFPADKFRFEELVLQWSGIVEGPPMLTQYPGKWDYQMGSTQTQLFHLCSQGSKLCFCRELARFVNTILLPEGEPSQAFKIAAAILKAAGLRPTGNPHYNPIMLEQVFYRHVEPNLGLANFLETHWL